MFTEKEANTESFSTQQALEIDAPDSVREKEAESAAVKVIHGDQLMGGENISNGLINGGNPKNKGFASSKAAGKQGSVEASAVREKINSSMGRGNALPDEMKHQMKGIGGNLDDVRIHTDSNAAEMSNAINADAFTVGKDIYFGQGKFDTYTSEGKKLLAHELAHTKQSSGMIQRSPQKTAWGEFTDHDYTAFLDDPLVGAGINLEFEPNDLVDAKKIGLVQISKQYYVDATGTHINYLDVTEEKQSIQKKDAQKDSPLNENEEGFQIDQDPPSKANPLYAGKELKKGQTLKDSRQMKRYGTFGCNYLDDVGTPHKKSATLGDSPQDIITDGVTEMGGVFEVAALAVEGAQQGAYYGSVEWGYKWDGTNVNTIALKTISEGAASSTFLKAASMWNISKTSKGKDTVDLPIPEYYQTTDTADFFGGDEFSASAGISLPAPVRVELLGTNIPVKEKPELVRVKIIDGIFSGISGWIDGTSLKKEDITVNPYGTK